MKTVFQKIVLTFGLLTMLNVTVFAQSDSTTTSKEIIYTDAMDKACQECWVTMPKKDLIIADLKKNEIDHKTIMKNDSIKKVELSDYSAQLKSDNESLQKKVLRLKKGKRINLTIGIATGLAAGLVIPNLF